MHLDLDPRVVAIRTSLTGILQEIQENLLHLSPVGPPNQVIIRLPEMDIRLRA